MRLATLVLLAVLAVLQYTLWLGKGGWLRIWSLERDIAAQAEKQRQLRDSNAIGHADVEDLRSGLGAVEERARREIGMVRKDETFFQYPQRNGAETKAAPAAEQRKQESGNDSKP
jgi:cell division protein FtsB